MPASTLPAQQARAQEPSSSPSLNPDRTFDLYVYAQRQRRLRPGADGADRRGQGRQRRPLATLVPGQFSAIKYTGANGLIGTAAGETTGNYVKVMTLSPDLSHFSLYFTSLTRPNAHCATAACNALPAGAPGEDRLAKYIADNLPPGRLRRLRAAGGRDHRRGHLVPADRRPQPGLRHARC